MNSDHHSRLMTGGTCQRIPFARKAIASYSGTRRTRESLRSASEAPGSVANERLASGPRAANRDLAKGFSLEPSRGSKRVGGPAFAKATARKPGAKPPDQ